MSTRITRVNFKSGASYKNDHYQKEEERMRRLTLQKNKKAPFDRIKKQSDIDERPSKDIGSHFDRRI